jgi:hypothetical protein
MEESKKPKSKTITKELVTRPSQNNVSNGNVFDDGSREMR